MLRNLGVTDLVVVGVWTNMAVEHTVRDAADRGYHVSIVTDATSSISAAWQHAAVSYALTNIVTITDTTAVVAALSHSIDKWKRCGGLSRVSRRPTTSDAVH